MTYLTQRAAWVAVAMAGALIAAAIGFWAAAVLFPRDPLSSRLAERFPWPVACSTRGCITTKSWEQHWLARQAFAKAAGAAAPTSREALITVVRHHLVRHAFLRVPVTADDAARYREEVLGLTDEAAVQETVDLTLADYDTQVLLPLLQQEALRQERSIESLDELFTILAQERPVVVLPLHLKWNKDTATVEER